MEIIEKVMKHLLVLLFSITSFNIFADTGDWEVVIIDGQSVVQHKQNPSIQRETFRARPGSEIVKVLPVEGNINYEIIVYFSEVAGTSTMIKSERAMIFDKNEQKLIGDFPWSYETLDLEPGESETYPQPQWDISAGQIKIEDESVGLEETISIN